MIQPVAESTKSLWPARPRRQLGLVAFAVFVAADDLMVVATMLRPMMKDLGLSLPGDLAPAAWIINVYLIAFLAVMPLAGRLSDRYGRREVFVAGLVAFALGSLMVPLAGSLTLLLVGRALTAIGGGALVPVSLAVVSDVYEGPSRARALGLLGAIETLGWVWGPLYGALLVRFLSWQWQFYLNVPMAVAGIVFGWRMLGSERHQREPMRWAPAVLLTVILVSANIVLLGRARVQTVTGLDQLGDQSGGVLTSAWFLVPASVALAVLVFIERRADEPFIARELTRSRSAVASLLLGMLVGGGLIVALVNVPLFVNVLDVDLRNAAVTAGWLLTAMTVAMAIASGVGGELSARSGPRRPAIVGLVGAAVAFAMMGFTWSVSTSTLAMVPVLALAGAGIGLTLTPSTVAVVDQAGPDDLGQASGLVLMARLLGFSIGLASMTAWGTRRYATLRETMDVPTLGSDGYEEQLVVAGQRIATSALTETFLGGAAAFIVALALVRWLSGVPRFGDR